LQTATLPTYSSYSSRFSSLGDVLYVQQPQAAAVIDQFLGEAPGTALTPPPGPYGAVPATTTTVPSSTTPESTPGTSAPSSTTTTIETDFDPTPC
ncbi:MAG: hypothetical protein ACRDYE_11010, partial [Acidimicrobiales bacterium]